MARYRLAFDIESDDTPTLQQLHGAAKAAEEYITQVYLPDNKITFNKAAASNRTAHLHESTRRRGCQHCVDLLANDGHS